MGLTLRADFPHDSFGTQVSVIFDSGEARHLKTEKFASPQYFSFEETITSKIVITNLIQNITDNSPFLALTQVKAFGREIKFLA
ncbi:hypothetical protein Hs30E_15140 [Lactococcus hodotermopsidis]|uniref:Uncharacterized protein n=1 Tax=Pseudolactococcus hodotermopsidis TaxID=2709157 RepID=A0A6A0BE40_9LACT|nr:hypothetical protein [Lactococcus hodotermopsidis]GFH42963.1 hypothetical protein Hs30E_15140 [Lactococcus hodotermopsidis]